MLSDASVTRGLRHGRLKSQPSFWRVVISKMNSRTGSC